MSRRGQADVSRCLAGRTRKRGKKVREKKDEEVSERQMAFKKRKAQRNRFTALSLQSLWRQVYVYIHMTGGVTSGAQIRITEYSTALQTPKGWCETVDDLRRGAARRTATQSTQRLRRTQREEELDDVLQQTYEQVCRRWSRATRCGRGRGLL